MTFTSKKPRFHFLFALGAICAIPALAEPIGTNAFISFVAKHQEVSVTKKEFETVADFNRRLNYLEQEFVVDFAPEHSTYNKVYEYDAETQTLTVFLPASKAARHVLVFKETTASGISNNYLRDYNMYMLKSDSDKPRDYKGQTAFGATVSVTTIGRQGLGLAVMNVSAKDLDAIAIPLRLGPDAAKALTSKLVWRFSGTTAIGVWEVPRSSLSERWAITSNIYKEATIDSTTSMSLRYAGAPALVTSISLVNKETGETLKSYVIKNK